MSHKVQRSSHIAAQNSLAVGFQWSVVQSSQCWREPARPVPLSQWRRKTGFASTSVRIEIPPTNEDETGIPGGPVPYGTGPPIPLASADNLLPQPFS